MQAAGTGKRVRCVKGNVWSDRSGAISVVFALVILPLMIVIGAAVDYAIASRTKDMLQSAADAAAVGSISMSSSAVKQVIQTGTVGNIAVAESDALNIAQTNFGGSRFSSITSSQISVRYANNTFNSDVTLTSDVPTYFVRLFGVNSVTVTARATAQNKPIYYYNFYVLIDNSPSMGLGATAADISALEAVNGGCAFACHLTGETYDTYIMAKQRGITLRYQVVSRAVQSMITKASSSQLVSNQYKMAVYSLGPDAEVAKLTAVAALSSSLSSVATAAANVDLMTIPYQNYNNDQQTDLLTALTDIKTIIGKSGTGLSATDPIKVLFLISDGVEDAKRPKNCKEKLNGDRCQQPIDTAPCSDIKANAVRLAGLYTTYQKIPSNTWYTTWIAPFQSKIATNMKACASEGLYAEVAPSGDVSAVLTQLFANVVNETHLTH